MGGQTSLPQGRIRVAVKNGWVYLKGEVDAECEKAAAEKCLEGLTGVRGVMKQVVVRPKASVSQLGAGTPATFEMASTN